MLPKDVGAGTSIAADKEGNDKHDEHADEGGQKINSKGLSTLGRWVARRHDKYNKLMRGVHNMIAVVGLAGENGKGQHGKDPDNPAGV